MKRQGPCYSDSLPLPSAELVRIAVDLLGSKAHRFHHFLHPLPALLRRSDPMDHETFRNDLPYSLARIERGVWVLKNYLHASAQGEHYSMIVNGGEVLAAKDNLTLSRRFQSQNNASEGRLPAAALARQVPAFHPA